MKLNQIIMAAMMVLLAATSSFGHHLWVMPLEDGYAVARGHVSKAPDAYDPACIQEIRAYDQSGKEVSVHRQDKKEMAVFKTDQPVSLATASSDWGYRVNTTQGKKLINRKDAEADGLKVISAFFSSQFSKTLFGPSPRNTVPLGMRIEIVPLTDPLQAGLEEEISYQLLVDGKPVAHAPIHTLDSREIQTDEKGIARIGFKGKGPRLLYASRKIPATGDKNMDYLMITAFLMFEGK